MTRFCRRDDRRQRLLEIEAPADLARFIAAKGSIAVQGVSLTVNGVERVALPREPHSAHARGDDARHARAGARVNLEVDLVARYVERLLEASRAT